MTNSPHKELNAYCDAKRRCSPDPENPCYKNYYGRGIRFLFTSFKEFIDDVGPAPEPHPTEGKYTLDRKDNNGNYEPGNIRWATVRTQNRNKRTTLEIEFRGETKLLVDWCKELGKPYYQTWLRITKEGFTVEQALTFTAADGYALRKERHGR